jgi:uncharacterized membrane protein YhaH (DUF805 family)
MRDLPQIGDIVYLKANPAVKMTVEKCTYTRNAAMVTCSVPDPVTGLSTTMEYDSGLLEKVIIKATGEKQRMFRNIFSFDGRIRRLEYGIIFSSYVLLLVAWGEVFFRSGYLESEYEGIFFLALIPLVWILFAANTKRCHDLGRSGGWQIVPFFRVMMLFVDGEPGYNDYGPNPKGIEE